MLNAGMYQDPKETYVGFFFVSGHGINQSGSHELLLNRWYSKTDFYKPVPIENYIISLANGYSNAYLVCIFATNRITYDAGKH